MLISHKFKFISIDIPKTGTKSLRKALMPLGIIDISGSYNTNFDRHASADSCIKAMQKINKNFHDYYSFCVIRNPWDRYFSFFKYYKEYYETHKNTSRKLTGAQKIQFDYTASLFQHKEHIDVLKTIIHDQQPQHLYFMNQAGQILVSHVAQFSNLTVEFQDICQKLGVSPAPQLPHENKTQKINYKNFYNQELIDLVYEKENLIINKYKYEYV